MKVSEARRHHEAGEAERRAIKAVERGRIEAAHKQTVAKERRNINTTIQDLYSRIKAEARRGEKKYNWVSTLTSEVTEDVLKRLRADGYSVQSHHVPGEYEEMGDFNAPCNIWREAYWYYTIAWL